MHVYLICFSCSVDCFKIHDCQQRRQGFVIDKPGTSAKSDSFSSVNKDSKAYLLEIPEDYIIPDEKLKKLKDSKELKELLENPHLRDFLKFTHDTYNPSGFMKLAMKEPLFVEFADACLKVIHPEDYQRKEISDQEIVEHIAEAIEDAKSS